MGHSLAGTSGWKISIIIFITTEQRRQSTDYDGNDGTLAEGFLWFMSWVTLSGFLAEHKKGRGYF
jgi:hypothetical protein